MQWLHEQVEEGHLATKCILFCSKSGNEKPRFSQGESSIERISVASLDLFGSAEASLGI